MEFLAKIAEILAAVEKATDGSIVSDVASVINAVEEVISDFKNKTANVSDNNVAE